MCKLCGSSAPLRKSHIIPKFIGRWMKETSATPYLRYGEDMDKRRQDLVTMELLCADCEERFSAWETKFANEIFYPSVAGKTVFKYKSWLLKFAASLTWRAIHFQRLHESEDSQALELILDEVENHLSQFLLDKKKHVDAYTHHIYPVGELSAPVEQGSPMLNRYFARTIDIDFLRNDDLSEVLVYVKIPMFMIFAVGKSKYRKWLETSRIKKSSTLQPKHHILEESMFDYIMGRADRTGELLNSMSPKSRAAADKAFRKALEKDARKVADSELMQAMRRDFEFYGKDAVVYRD